MNGKWPHYKLGDVLTPIARDEIVDSSKDYRLLGIRLDGNGTFIRETIKGTQVSTRRLFRVTKGDFIYSRLFACRGAFGIVDDRQDGCYVSGEFPTFVPMSERINVKFLTYWFRLPNVIARVVEDCSGSTPLTRNRFKENFFLALEIPLPPLRQQRRIVAQIEELSAKIGQAKALRSQAAEEAEVVMACASARAYDRAAAVAGTKRLDDLCSQITDGTHSTPRYIAAGVPFLSVKDITSGRISFLDVKYISAEEHTELARRCNPKRGDILLTKVGTTGFAKVIDVDRQFSIFVSLALLKLKADQLDARFAEFMLNSSRLREYSAAGTRGVGNKNLVLKFIREFPMPAPPLSEQRLIVSELDALQVHVDALKRLQAETAGELDALLPSILDKAFKGEL